MLNNFYKQPEVLELLQHAFKRDRSIALGGVIRSAKIPNTHWKHISIPDQCSCDFHRPLPIQQEIAQLVKRITGKQPVRIGARRFRHRDFTLLHDKDTQKPGIVALYFPNEWREEWGGTIVFMKNGKTLERFVPKENTLLIVERKKGVRYFVKYINHHAGNDLVIL